LKVEHWNIGPEFDGPLIARIRQFLTEFGFKQVDYWNGLVGSQEILHWEYSNPEGRLVLEAETYIGVTIEGPGPLVKKIKEAFQTLQQQNPYSEKH
jgi:hypothetical protein